MKTSRVEKRSPSTRRKANSLLTALVCGFAGGLGGVSAMDRFTSLAARCRPEPDRSLSYSLQEWDATTRLANLTACWMTGRKLQQKELKTGAAIVHHTTGAAAGALYGALVYRSTANRAIENPFGLGFGVGVWYVGNELLLPALGVMKREDYTTGMRTEALVAHAAYGAATGLLYRKLTATSTEAE
jgi:hypothetical protein